MAFGDKPSSGMKSMLALVSVTDVGKSDEPIITGLGAFHGVASLLFVSSLNSKELCVCSVSSTALSVILTTSNSIFHWSG